MFVASDLTRQHLEKIRAFFDAAPTTTSAAARYYRTWLARYYNLYIPAGASVLEIGCGSGELLAQLRARRKVGLDLSATQLAAARTRVPEAEFHLQAGEHLSLTEKFDCIIISDTLNLAADVQLLLEQLHPVTHADTRLVINYYSSLWRPLLALGQWLGLRTPQPQFSWLTMPANQRRWVRVVRQRTVAGSRVTAAPIASHARPQRPSAMISTG